ncbi:MAG: hypothetical protein AAF805_15270 [Planctomycetota bacterium]
MIAWTAALLVGSVAVSTAHQAGRVEFALSDDGTAWRAEPADTLGEHRVVPGVGLKVVIPAMGRPATHFPVQRIPPAEERTTGIGIPLSIERAMLLDGTRTNGVIR